MIDANFAAANSASSSHRDAAIQKIHSSCSWGCLAGPRRLSSLLSPAVSKSRLSSSGSSSGSLLTKMPSRTGSCPNFDIAEEGTPLDCSRKLNSSVSVLPDHEGSLTRKLRATSSRLLEAVGAVNTALHIAHCSEPEQSGVDLARDDEIRDFPYATYDDLDNPHTSCLIGKRVCIKEHTINVLGSLGSGRTGSTFCVQVVEPACQAGTLMALKYRIGSEDIDNLRHEAKIMMKIDSSEHAPHTVSMICFGYLKVPRWGVLHFLPRKSIVGIGLLITLAPGVPMGTVALGEAEKVIVRQQLKNFAEAMYSKRLIHADLTVDNIFWNQRTSQVTVIDFGNSLEIDEANATVKRRAAFLKFQNARHEMERFLFFHV